MITIEPKGAKRILVIRPEAAWLWERLNDDTWHITERWAAPDGHLFPVQTWEIDEAATLDDIEAYIPRWTLKKWRRKYCS